MTTKADISKTAQEVTEKLLLMMGVDGKVTVEKTETEIKVLIDAGESSGLLIGNRGRTLQSLQTVISMMVNNGLKEWTRVIIDISSWRQKEEDRLIALANQTAERVLASGRPQSLYNLNPTQRRIVHLTLADRKDIKTESKGEGIDRYLEVSLA